MWRSASGFQRGEGLLDHSAIGAVLLAHAFFGQQEALQAEYRQANAVERAFFMKGSIDQVVEAAKGSSKKDEKKDDEKSEEDDS